MRNYLIGGLGVVEGTLDYLEIQEYIDNLLPDKTAPNSGCSYGTLIRSIILQMTDSPYPAVWGIQEFYCSRPCSLLLGADVTSDALNRHALGRCLDVIYQQDPSKLFLQISYHVMLKLGLHPLEAHIDSNSYHYDGEGQEELDCLIQFRYGYSRDHRSDLKQINELMIVEENIGLPLLAKAISGNIADKEESVKFNV